MKKIIILCVLGLSVVAAGAQQLGPLSLWILSSSGIIWNPSGKTVGVCTQTTSVDMEIRDCNNDAHTEIRLTSHATAPTNNFLALYHYNGAGFLEVWNDTAAQFGISPKPQDAASNANVGVFRDTNTSGASNFNVYKGDGTSTQNVLLSGKTHSYLESTAGFLGVGVSTSNTPQAPLHVNKNQDELARFTKVDAALGLSFGYNEGGNTHAYLYNRYTGSTAAMTFGFGATFGSSVTMQLTKDGNVSVPGSSTGSLTVGSVATPLTLVSGEVGLSKITASGSAPGSLGGKIELVCGTAGGSAKLIAYAGTSTTPVTILDNIGAGVTGC